MSSMVRRTGPAVASLLAALLLTAGCGGGGDTALIVFAAASLTDAFEDLGHAFEAAHPGTEVIFSFGSSSGLAQQVLDGAPADVFASADIAHVATAVDLDAGAESEPFARNRLVLGVPAGNRAAVSALADLARDELLIGLCAPQVPCGRAARSLLGAAGVDPAIDTEEGNARALLAKLAAGELDVGLAYRTDVQATAGAVESIEVDHGGAGEVSYAITTLTGPGPDGSAARFIAYVQSADGQAILDRHGFLAP